MDTVDSLALTALAAQVAMGVTLAALAGLRAFLPPLALGIAARAELVSLSPEFAWLADTPTLVALGSAVILEILADKIPVVDNFLDAAGTVLRPAAGALVAAVPLVGAVHALDSDPGRALVWAAGITGVVVGGAASGAVHMAKAGLRLGSTPATAGTANPFLSLLEDVVGFIGTTLAVLAPLLGLAGLVLGAAAVILVVRRRRAIAPQH
jgi:hypothetical protein